jgi:hypothetical protein
MGCRGSSRLPPGGDEGRRKGGGELRGLAVAVGLLSHESFNHVDDLLLLAARQSGDGGEKLTGAATGAGNAGRLGLTQQLFHGDAEGFGNGNDEIDSWQSSSAFPKTHVGGILSDEPRELSLRQTRSLS